MGYGHPLLFGSFLSPAAAAPDQVVALARLSEQVGLDLVTIQDHPYQPAFLDTWTLLANLAARTETVRLAPNVLNLPLRPPAVLARSAASLDLLSGGRFELAIGAGAFWDAIEAMGGHRLTPGQAVDALEEAVSVLRQVWDTDTRGVVRVEGEHYRVVGAKRGPAPAHEISVWVGALKPRMLRLVGKVADGWLPSLSYIGAPERLAELNSIIDDSASEAGRSGSDIRRLLNVSGEFTARSGGLLNGPAEQWVDELSELATRYGVSAFILGSDDPAALQVFGEQVAPAVREQVLVGADVAMRPRSQDPATARDTITVASDDGSLGVTPTVDDGLRRSTEQPWDEATRPTGPTPAADRRYTARERAMGRHLVDIHDHLRTELTQLEDLVEQVRAGRASLATARSALNEMSMRQNDWTLGAYCASYCRVVTGHHTLEDTSMFPHLRSADPRLAPVLDRLDDEHHVIHGVLDRVDAALVHLVAHPEDLPVLDEALALLSDTLLSHLAYEERELVEPLARLGYYPGQA